MPTNQCGNQQTTQKFDARKVGHWMASEQVVNEIAKEPSHQQVAEWLVDGYSHIPNQLARNA